MDILINLYITWAHTKGRGFLGDNTENQHEIDLGKQKFASFLMRNKEKNLPALLLFDSSAIFPRDLLYN